MTTNLELVQRILAAGSKKDLEDAAINMAKRLDLIANLKPESPVGQLQIVTGAEYFHPH